MPFLPDLASNHWFSATFYQSTLHSCQLNLEWDDISASFYLPITPITIWFSIFWELWCYLFSENAYNSLREFEKMGLNQKWKNLLSSNSLLITFNVITYDTSLIYQCSSIYLLIYSYIIKTQFSKLPRFSKRNAADGQIY